MTQEDTLVVRESRTTVVIALLVCAILSGIGIFSIGGPFHFAAIGFMILIGFFIGIVLWSTAFVTVLTSTGLHGRSFGKRWQYPWGDVESWGLEYDPQGEFSIWFKPEGATKRHYIQALGNDMKVKVRECFTQYCGDPRIDETIICSGDI